ncbi:Uncharacterized protein APZ42_028456 [Daphnia magna]|uniref:RNA-directed DNA polymerase n=1 Tax=Daphnia magna TaxID=35525 RepID=A0A164QHP1_9CRUS|nr:Uncharacterized protein APZ42_028456 [Daphnia magna]
MGVIEPTQNSWRLKEVKTKDVYPLPRIDHALSQFEGAALFSVVDHQSGYWQVPVAEDDEPKTAFVTPDGLYQFRVMPFGLCSATSTFQRLMDMVLAGLKWTDCLVYMDDVVIFGKDAKEHLERLGKVFSCFRKANLNLKMEICAFGNERGRMLGLVVSKAGIELDPEHCEAIEMFPGPNPNANEKAKRKWVKSFVGLCSFYRKFVPNFVQVAYPLTVMDGKGVFCWGEPERNGFAELKAALVKAAQLAHPDYSKNFEVHPDACDYGIGVALMQERNGQPMPICFVSRILNKSERNYTITEKECLAIVWAVEKFRPYIWGTKIGVKTDHHALCWLMTKQKLSGWLERWSLSLQEPGEAVAMDQASNDQEWFPPVRKLHAEGGLTVPENNQGSYPLCPKLQELQDPEIGSREVEEAEGDNAGGGTLRAEAVIPADLLVATGPSQPKPVSAEDLMKAMVELREDEKDRLAMVQQRQKTQCDASVRTRKPSVNLSPGAEEGARGKVTALIRGSLQSDQAGQ